MQTIVDARWRLFVKVADLGSVSGAAVALDLPQSVVSRQIAQLETESGARLFRRTGRGVVLTEFGEQVYPRIMALIRQAEQLADEMRTRSGMPIGDVRCGLLPSTVPLLAGVLFSEVRKQWPEVRLHLTEGSSAQLEEWLGQGRLDMALLLREEDTARPDEPVLVRLPLCLVVPAGHLLAKRKSIPFEEVARLPLVLPSEPHPLLARLAVLAREHQVSLVQALEADSIRLQHEIVACGGGFAITAGALMQHDARRLAAVRITRPTLWRSIVLGITAHRPHTLATRSVASLIRSMATATLKAT
ncbi:LysR family transcriptional regulator (plasmid) [Variovorax sp. V59]|uniref:LysR family transcriptional regulator n=1 Tax=unclassified Variovorax TaxID=663243 RepID=UPI0034E8A49A